MSAIPIAANPIDPDPRRLVERCVAAAVERGASDLHLEPTAQGYEVRARVDGVLELVERVDREAGRAMVGRLMVMAQLLTYRQDVPQEGRLSMAAGGEALELRLAVMPTTHGLRAAVRTPAELVQPRRLADLGLPPQTLDHLLAFAHAEAGLLLLTGPAGSGKTTTIYALLEHMAGLGRGLSIISLEDPVERDLPGVTQIEVSPFGELTYDKALRSILRQDPQVLVLGEIRDPATAGLAAQAAMSGHRLISTLHAGSPGGAIVRLLDMGVEPYQITSSLFGVATMRLLRRRGEDGYRGRVPVAEFARMDEPLRQAVLAGEAAQPIDALLSATPGHVTIRSAASALTDTGVTDADEVRRVLGDA